MKTLSKILLGALLLTVPLASYAGKYKLTGNVTGLPENSVILLAPVTHLKEKNIGEVPVVNGKFSFEGSVDQPTAVWVKLKGVPSGARVVMLDEGEVTLTGDVKTFDANGSTGYELAGLKVSGSPNTDKYDKIYGQRAHLNKLYEEKSDKYSEVWSKVRKARISNDEKALADIMATDEYKAADKAEKDFFTEVEATYRRIVFENKDSFWGPLMMISLFSYLTPDQQDWYDALSDEAKNSYYGKKVYEEINPAFQIGQNLSDFSIAENGKNTTFHKICECKKVVILDFWASWCRPCRAEIPHLKSIYEKHKNNGLDIVSVSIDADNAAWEKALKKENMSWHNLRDADENIAILYKVRAVPQIYIVDSNGNLIGENLRGEELAKKIDEILAVN